MKKLLALMLCILLITIGIIIIPTLAQENPAGLQGDDVEVFASDGAFISLQGDDIEIYANGSDIDANPLAVMQGDDSEIFVIQSQSNTLQGDDTEVFTPSNQVNNVSVSDSDTVEANNVELALANTLPDANLAILDTIPDEIGAGLPDVQANNWQEPPVDITFLIIGGSLVFILLLLASLLIVSGTLKIDSR